MRNLWKKNLIDFIFKINILTISFSYILFNIPKSKIAN